VVQRRLQVLTETDSQIGEEDLDKKEFPYREETHTIIGIGMEVHRILGNGRGSFFEEC
jgi:hypothetical protein